MMTRSPWTELVEAIREAAAMYLIRLVWWVMPRGSWLGTQYLLMTKLLFEAYVKHIRQEEEQRQRAQLQAEWQRKIKQAR